MRFVEAEESAKFSLSDSKLCDSVSGVSSFKRQQGGVVKKEVNPPVHNPHPYFCHKCQTMHKSRQDHTCEFCKHKGHCKERCKAFQRSQMKEGSKGDVKNKAGEEADKIMEVWGSN
jgi:hypothetical protein